MAKQTFEDIVGKEAAGRYRKREKAWADTIEETEDLLEDLVDICERIQELQNRKYSTGDFSDELTDWNYHTPRKYWDRMYDDIPSVAYNAGEYLDALS